jgi:hypothetical protein
MSYDVYLEIDTGGTEPVEVSWLNHTSNTAAMWRAAGCDIAECDGRPAANFAEGLASAIEAIESDPDRYRQYEPPNGWGTLETTLKFLRDLLHACQCHPRTTVRVSR